LYYVLLGFTFLFMMGHCTLYIDQYSNNSASNLSLSYFHQTPLVHIFSFHGLYISNMVSDLNRLLHFLLSCWFPAMAKIFSLILQQECEFKSTFYSTSQDSIANLAFHEGYGKHFCGGLYGNRGRGRFHPSGGRNSQILWPLSPQTNHTSGNCWIKHDLPQGYHQNTKVYSFKPTASMVDTASYPFDLYAGNDEKVEAQFGFSRECKTRENYINK